MYKEEKEVTVYTGPNNTKYEKIGTIYVSEGMTVFNKIENGHEYVEYGTKVGLKRGYVPISTLTNVENVYVPTISGAGIEKIVYGTSEKNQDLVAYKLGNGSKILISVFAIHGFEDAWAADGVELSRMAIKVTQDLATYKSANGGLNGWTVYIIPAANPDGITYGYTNDGPGRCTIESQTDMNRSFPERFSAFTSGSRNYTGETKLGSKEAKSLYNFIESKSPDVFLDIHGWENKTLGNAEIGRYFEEQFGFGHTDAFQEGGIADWAKTLKNKTTKSALIELPMPSSPQDIANRGFGQKVSNAISNIVKKGATASTNGWVQIDNKWYYHENGDMIKGWKQLGDTWYYMDESGVMQTGWQSIGGNKYYFESSGAMAKNVTMDGYEINGEGIAKKKEEDLPSNIFETITMDINGQKINFSWQKVKGKYFLFPATRRDMEKYHHAYAISFSPKELVSMIIGITPADAYKDTIDFIYGKDIITGEKLNRGLLLTMIITPEIIDVMFKKGVKNADELKNLFKNGSKGAAEAGTRRSVRLLDEVADVALSSRVKEIRGLLPSDLKRGGNFGIAKVEIQGIKNELYAHSGIDVIADARSAASNVSDITLKPTNPIFKATSVPTNDGTMLFRDMDTEYKILNNIAEKLGDNTSVSGKIRLFTERPCCDSCNNVIVEFLEKYKNISIEVVHNNGTLLRP